MPLHLLGEDIIKDTVRINVSRHHKILIDRDY